MTAFTLVLGTHNSHKKRELVQLLAPHGFTLLTLQDFPNALRVEESGSTFTENATLKAVVQAKHLQHWILGEDSGLSVDALDGAPGVHSSRFAGEPANDERNNDLLLQKLANTPLEKRTAHYTCHVTIADPLGNVRFDGEGRCSGRIRFARAGSAGFGYDPLFEIPEYHATFGELGDDVKSVLSHRARAMRQAIPALIRLAKHEHWRPRPTR
jgi:XTP/dITP diphosphohydrolase